MLQGALYEAAFTNLLQKDKKKKAPEEELINNYFEDSA